MRISKAVGRLAVTMKLMALLCALVILPFGSFVLRADAAEGKANLTVNWDQKDQELVLYRVAVRNSDGSYTLTDDFKDYGVDILNADEKQLENAAELLAAYATRDKLEPLNKLKTDGTGKYTFSDLDYGAYMVFNKATVEGNTTSAVPVFVYLEKDMEVQIKPLDEVTTSCKVYKIWDDNDSKDRPDSIVIQLLNEDGSVRDEQTLSGKNNWYYAWTNLPEGKAVLTGTPIRSELLKGNADAAYKLCGFNKDLPVLMIIGGSTGSVAINKEIRSSLPKLLKDFQVVHLCGAGNIDNLLLTQKGYKQFEYLKSELKDILAMADIVVSRAGANVICELLALKKPNLLIPLPASASRGDQILNAASFEAQGYSLVLSEEDMDTTTLTEKIYELYCNRSKYEENMESSSQFDAVGKIIGLIEEYSSSTIHVKK